MLKLDGNILKLFSVGCMLLAVIIAVPAIKISNSDWYRNRELRKFTTEQPSKEMDSIDAATVLIARDEGPVYDGS